MSAIPRSLQSRGHVDLLALFEGYDRTLGCRLQAETALESLPLAAAARNIPNIDVLPVAGINVYDVMRRHKLVLTRAALDALEARFK